MFIFCCERLAFISLCFLIFVLPASIGGVSIFSGITILFFLLYKISSGMLVARRGKCWWSVLRAKAFELWLAIPLACFVGINFLAVLWSQYPGQSRKAFIGKVLGHVLIYLAAQEAINSPRRLRILINVFFCSAVIICLDALFQLWCGHDFFKKALLVTGRVSAAFNHPNGLGAYLVLALPLMFGMTAFYWKQWRESGKDWAVALFLTAGLLLGLAVMGLTYSRGAWLGFVVVVLVFLLFNRKLFSMFFAMIAVLAFLVYVPMLKAYRHVSLVSEDLSASTAKQMATVDENAGSRPTAPSVVLPAGEAQTLQSNDWLDKLYVKLVKMGIGGSDRLIYWRDAIKIVRDHPWTGTGLNTYAKAIKKYNGDRALYPHNGYLQMTAELGLFGLVSFLWLIAVHLIHGIRMARMMDPKTALLWTVGLAGFIGFLVHGFFDTIFYSVQHGALLWFFLGLLAAGQALTIKKEPACR